MAAERPRDLRMLVPADQFESALDEHILKPHREWVEKMGAELDDSNAAERLRARGFSVLPPAETAALSEPLTRPLSVEEIATAFHYSRGKAEELLAELKAEKFLGRYRVPASKMPAEWLKQNNLL